MAPLFSSFPYTDYHQMNLQYLLERVKLIEQMQSDLNELSESYSIMNERVNVLSASFDNFSDDMQQQFNDLQTTLIQALDTYITNAQNDIGAALDSMYYEMVTAFGAQNAIIDALSTRVESINTDLIQLTYVDSPFTGEPITVQQAIYELASLHMTDALTAAEYDAADLTAAAYDALDLTAYAYDWNGKTYIS